MAGVAYNQIKDGGVYTISNRLLNGMNKNYLSYGGTFTYGQEPANCSESYWIAHKSTNNTFYFESYAVRNMYLNATGIADTPTAIGSVIILSDGLATGYISLNTNIPTIGDKYLAGYADGHGFGSSCYVTSKAHNESFSSDWEFIPVLPTGIYRFASSIQDRGYLIDKVSYVSVGKNNWMQSEVDADNSNSLWYLKNTDNGKYIIASLSYYDSRATNVAFLKGTGNGTSYQNTPFEWTITYKSTQSRTTSDYGHYDRTIDVPDYFELKNGTNCLGATPGATGDYNRVQIINTEAAATYWEFQTISETVLTSEQQTLLERIIAKTNTNWQVAIKGGTSSTRVTYNEHQYADGDIIVSNSTPDATDLTINVTDQFVWGPIIDAENRTVTFEIRDVASTLTAGRFYQVEIKPGTSGTLGGSSQADLVSTIKNNIKAGGHKSNYIYLQCADSPSNRSDYRSILNYDGYTGTAYKSYIYVLNVASNNSLTMQHINGKYVDGSGIQSDTQQTITNNELDKQSDNSFVWNRLGAWVLNSNDITPYIGRGISHTNTMQTFFHPVSTGEDYDIYKVITAGEVECTNANLVTKITNAGGTFFFLQKGTEVTAGDFLINGSEPTAITTNTVNGYIELTLTERPHEVHEITTLAGITDMYGYYKLTADISSAPTQISADFHGELDGNYHKITGATSALFAKLVNGTVKNVILEDVSISSGDIVGAIANTATGNSRVYNCGVLSGTVNGSTEAGSILGRIEGNARVVNCYSYADVSGGTVAGIVGNNAGTSAVKETVFNGTGTLVMNCAYFGKLSGSSVYPVFGGNDINNVSGVNTYNYYLYDASVSYDSPNSAQGTEETSYFNRFDFYRGILNSHRELAAMYIHGTQNVSQEQIENIAHWKYDGNVAEYLSLEPWPKNVRRTLDRKIPATDEAYKGKQVGTVSATFKINGHSETVTLPITDMNTDRWDYTYGKVVLPFANEFSGWTMPASGSTAYDNIITGWEVTSITGGTAGTYSNYNLCDPDCTAKDLYENNNYVWAQGGNFVVPKDVTAITFTAHIVRAVYLRDTHPDIAYNENYSSRVNLGTQISGTYNGKTVYNSMADAFANLENKTNPADQAIVLVGNYHFNKEGVFPNAYGNTSPVAAKAVTIMSIDADNNQDPDYCFYQFNTGQSGRVVTPPLRFDFVTSPGFAMASYTKGGYLAEIGIIHAGGWLETTETATLSMTEFEMRPQNFLQPSPVILNGGVFSRAIMTSTNEYGAATDNLLYTKIGGNAYVKMLNLGRFSSSISNILSLHPLNVSGGEIVNCHMTGAVHDGNNTGNVSFYCNGGYIHEFNGAYLEKVNGNMQAQIDHALIDEFYGGGADDTYKDAQIAGDINITCNNSYVKFFCGGPKFGNMAEGKTIIVNATGTVFDEYYGASYGGTALTQFKVREGAGSTFSNSDIPYDLAWTNYTENRLKKQANGIGVNFDLDYFQYAGGGQNKGNEAFYVDFASLSLAKTGSVTSNMIRCTFNSHFFGGGCRGLVDGDVSSTLTDCVVKGNAYGGGYTPTATQCMVYPSSPQPSYPVYRGQYGLFTKYVRTEEPVAYTWQHTDDANKAADDVQKIIYTTVDMTQMGVVTGNTSLTIKGENTVINGDVFGGGAESKVLGNSTVVIGEQP